MNAVYDPFRDRMLFYGGVSGDYFPDGFTYYDETWSLSLSGAVTWTFLPPRTAVAYARKQAAGVLDSLGQRMIVLSGQGPGAGLSPDPSNTYNDVWALDLSLGAPGDSANWTPLPSGPPARAGAAAWVDPVRRRLLQVGGYYGEIRVDQWALALDGDPVWSNLVPDSLPLPPTYGHQAFIDRSRGQWLLGFNDWRAQSFGHDMLTDMPWRPVSISGGPGLVSARTDRDEAGAQNLVLSGADLWSLQDGAASWTPLPASVLPPDRTDPLMVFDSLRRRVVIHGGWFTSSGKTKARTDTWTRLLGDPTWQALTAGSFGRWGEVGVYDPVRDRLVAFGGIDTLGAKNDVHVLPLGGGGVWTPLATTGTPPPANTTSYTYYSPPQFYRAAYDADGDRMLVIGSVGSNLRVYALTLGATPTWSAVAVDGLQPGARDGFASVFNAPEGQWLISGGGDFDTHVNDVWALYLDPESSVSALPMGYEVLPDHIHLAWQEVGLPLDSFKAYRRDNGGPWQAIAALVPDGDRRLTLDDPVSTSVSSYDYRVSAIVGGTEQFFGEVNIPFGTSVPPATGRVSFEARPNPTRGAIDLAVGVVSPSTLRIELLDLSGRRVVERTPGALSPGEHMFRLAEPHVLPPGLYFARVSEGRRQTIVKVVVIQ